MAKSKRKSSNKSRRRSDTKRPRSRLPGKVLRFGLKMALVACLLWVVIALGFYAWALTYDLSKISDMPQRSAVYDRNGKFYSRLAGENRIVVPFDKVSNDFVNALITREDTRFYFHHGVDPIGVARAIVRNLLLGGFREGASTITQQLARNSFPLGGRNLARKVIEAALAFRIETELSKEEILEAYMNRIYFGSGYYGLETASQAYFGKPASRLTLAESATLAGLIRSPNRFSPFKNPTGAIKERDTVLKRMKEVGQITTEQMDTAMATPLDVAVQPPSTPQENWAMGALLHELELVISRDQLDEGGLNVFTTIDANLQREAEKALEKRLIQIESSKGFPHRPMASFPQESLAGEDSTPYLQAAALAMDNKTGGIRAIVGGRDYDRSKFHRALYGRRQIGSAVKPFVYAKAFEKGLKPGDPVSDSRLGSADIPKKYGHYSPENSDGVYGGQRRAEDGLIESRNTMTVRAGMQAGLDDIADTVVRAGLSIDPPRFPSICLGTFESNLKDLTASYTAFATGGTRMQPYLIEHITDADGKVIYKSTHGKLQILDPAAARMTSETLEKVVERGTASHAHDLGLHGRAAGKTGTTNNYLDAWFVGYTSSLTCGVWVGFDKPTPIMPGGYGGALALPIWVDIMEASHK